jgi:hypothetical protein
MGRCPLKPQSEMVLPLLNRKHLPARVAYRIASIHIFRRLLVKAYYFMLIFLRSVGVVARTARRSIGMKKLPTLLFATLACVVTYAQDPISADSPYHVRYASNLTTGDSAINITNTGAFGAGLGSGTTASVTGSICANQLRRILKDELKHSTVQDRKGRGVNSK